MATEKRVRGRASLLHVDLKHMREPWTVWCTQRGLTASEGARRVVSTLLDGSATSSSPIGPGGGDEAENDMGRRRLEIRLTHAEHVALEAVAGREGMSVPRWLTGLVRLHLTGEAQFGETEIRALTRSSQILLALGRSLNQIGRGMTGQADREDLTLSQIDYLSGLIKSHTQAVSAVLTANSRRWRR